MQNHAAFFIFSEKEIADNAQRLVTSGLNGTLYCTLSAHALHLYLWQTQGFCCNINRLDVDTYRVDELKSALTKNCGICMAYILALEAAADSCSVTLRTPAAEQTLEISEARSHSKHFLPLVQTLLKDHEISPAELDFIACGSGPGSFTGLRICFGMAQGLAFGLHKSLLTVTSLESMAFLHSQQEPAAHQRVISVLDARMGEVYLGEFDTRSLIPQQIGELQLLSCEQTAEFLQGRLGESGASYALVGAGAALVPLEEKLKGSYTLFDHIQPRSSAVAEIALQRWIGGEAPSPSVAEICYLRNSVSWNKRKRIRS